MTTLFSEAFVYSVSAGAGSVSELFPGYMTHSGLVLSICLRSCKKEKGRKQLNARILLRVQGRGGGKTERNDWGHKGADVYTELKSTVGVQA